MRGGTSVLHPRGAVLLTTKDTVNASVDFIALVPQETGSGVCDARSTHERQH